MTRDDPGTLLYDPHCSLCTRLARLARGLSGGRLTILGIEEAIERGMLDGLSTEAAWASMHHVDRDGTVRSGPQGVAPVVASWPGGRALVAMFGRIPAARRANTALYWRVADGRSDACRSGTVQRRVQDPPSNR